MIYFNKITPNPRIFLPLFILLQIFAISIQAQETVGKQKFIFVGHRGASYLAPENTVASIKLAWELGADAAECDVMLSSDDRVVVFHDNNTKKLTGESHDIAKTPWKTLKKLEIKLRESNLPEYEGQTIPLLKDLLATIPPDRMLVIEIKTGPEILPYLKGIVDDHWKSGKIAFISFNFDAVRQAKSIYPDVPCYYLSAFKKDAKKHIAKAIKHELDGLNLRYSIIDQDLSDNCRDAGLDLWCWTVNDPQTALKMKALGVSAITTDRPAWIKKQIMPEANRAKQPKHPRYEAEAGSFDLMQKISDANASGGL